MWLHKQVWAQFYDGLLLNTRAVFYVRLVKEAMELSGKPFTGKGETLSH